MNGHAVRLFIARRLVPQDGTRQAIADGHVERGRDVQATARDDRTARELGEALSAVPVAEAGHRIRLDQQQGGRP